MMTPRVCLQALLVGLVLGITSPRAARGDDAAQLLSVAKAGHRAARESIRTLAADFVVEMKAPRSMVLTRGQYWRSRSDVRIREGQDGIHVADTLVRSGEIRTVARTSSNNRAQYHVLRRSSAEKLGLADVWERTMLTIVGPNSRAYPVNELLDMLATPAQVSKARLGGHDCVRVNIHFTAQTGIEFRLALWLDAECNYLVRKTEWTYPSVPNERLVAEVEEFAEPAPGVFVPVRCRVQELRDATVTQETVTTLTNVVVNADIPAKAFALPAVPAGTELRDLIQGTRYPIDPNWRAIGPAKRAPAVKVAAPARDAEPAQFSGPSEAEPTPASHWILYAAAAVLAAAAAGWGIRAIRRRTAPSTADTTGGRP